MFETLQEWYKAADAYIFSAELCVFLLQDPLEQVSSAAVLHNNTEEAISWTNKSTVPIVQPQQHVPAVQNVRGEV